MENYYQEMIREIEDMIENGQLAAASFRLEQELNMPYVPADAEAKLQQIHRDLVYRMAEEKESSEPTADVLLERLKGEPQNQLAAAAKLSERNLRSLSEEIKEWLSHEPQPEAAALIIAAIGEQEIDDEFVLVKDGVEYAFWGDDVIPPAGSGGFLKALECLKTWLENDRPDLFEMCRTMLVHEVYLFLPLSYDEEEGEELAWTILDQVSGLMDDGATAAEIRSRYLKPRV